ncbi:unnamed protein product [Paramecium sonneborni]|uniref:Transmembrane protein n=1 Tax=Paramecium sonneborni TaxID=65129 RepID=A0A8S1QVY0_9CILI|nr:unnamed protein product [Paramecium sonneborni]
MLFSILFLQIYQINGLKLFKFELNSFEISSVTLEFKVKEPYLQIDLGCDFIPSKIWTALNQQSIIVTPEERIANGCGDHYFSIWITDLETQDCEYTIRIYNYHTQGLYKELNFLYDQIYHQKTQPQENIAYYKQLFTPEDFMITISTTAYVFVEIFQSEFSMGPLQIKQVNPNNQYRNVTSKVDFWFQDIFQAQAGQQYFYRIQNYNDFYTFFYFKYQILKSSSSSDVYLLSESQTPTVQLKKNKIFLNIPPIYQYGQTILYKIIITSNWVDSNLIQCSFGDEELLSKMNLTEYYALYYHNQSDYDSHQQFVSDYLDQFDRDVLIYVFGFIQHTDFIQTVPYNKVYLANIKENDYKLLYILAPVIIFVFALLSILVAYLCLKKKRLSIQQEQQKQLWNQNYITPLQVGNIQ